MNKQKNPLTAALLSAFVFAGAGQIYNRQFVKGMLLAVFYGILLYITMKPFIASYSEYISQVAKAASVEDRPAPPPLVTNTNEALTLLSTLVWLYAVIDAHLTAKKTHENEEVKG